MWEATDWLYWVAALKWTCRANWTRYRSAARRGNSKECKWDEDREFGEHSLLSVMKGCEWCFAEITWAYIPSFIAFLFVLAYWLLCCPSAAHSFLYDCVRTQKCFQVTFKNRTLIHEKGKRYIDTYEVYRGSYFPGFCTYFMVSIEEIHKVQSISLTRPRRRH